MAVRGGRHFPKFRRALLLGSTADDGSVAPPQSTSVSA
jgi:hypothetical protein